MLNVKRDSRFPLYLEDRRESSVKSSIDIHTQLCVLITFYPYFLTIDITVNNIIPANRRSRPDMVKTVARSAKGIEK